MEQKNLVPKRRFKEFQNASAWEQRRLGDYTKLITKGTTPRNKSRNGEVNFVKVENIINGKILPVAKITEEEHENYLKRSKLEEQDILFSIAGTLGRTAVVNKSILPANTNQALAIIRGYEFDTDFLITSLGGQVVEEYIRKNPTVGAQPNFSLEQVRKLIVWTPCRDEQAKIGSFFKNLDNLITLHQRKLEKMKALKFAYLSEMFPAEGERLPKRRFAGFTQAWEEHSLSKVGDFVRTIVDPQATPEDSFVEYSMPSYDNGRNPETVFGDSMHSMRLKISGDVLLINKLNIRQKRIWLVKDAPSNAVASSEFMPFTSTEIDLAFLEQLMLSDKVTRDLESISSGTSNSQKRITPSDVLKYLIKLPVDRAEQEKIGSFFKNIDNLITLHQRKLEKLQNLKKAYLNEMFV